MSPRPILIWLILALLTVGTVTVGPGAAAQATEENEPQVSTTLAPADGIGSILGPRPGEGIQPDDAGARGGAGQVATFWLIMVALGLIVLLVLRDMKKKRAAL